jgi:hypothetical protein
MSVAEREKTERKILVGALRPLTNRELDVIETALEMLAESNNLKAKEAQSILEQDMASNLLWNSN